MEYRSRVASRRVGTSECRFSVRARGATTRSYPNKQRCVFPVLYNTWNESRLTEARLRTAHSDDRQLARLRCRPARHRDGEDAVRVVRGDVSQTCVARQAGVEELVVDRAGEEAERVHVEWVQREMWS